MSSDDEAESHSPGRVRVPLRVWGGLAVAILLDTMVQIIWKATVRDVSRDAGTVQFLWALARRPAFYLVILLALAQFANWMALLAVADVSFCQPLTALGYVTVGLCSVVLLGEHIGWTKGAGTALILAGVAFISRTPYSTREPGQEFDVLPVGEGAEA